MVAVFIVISIVHCVRDYITVINVRNANVGVIRCASIVVAGIGGVGVSIVRVLVLRWTEPHPALRLRQRVSITVASASASTRMTGAMSSAIVTDIRRFGSVVVVVAVGGVLYVRLVELERRSFVALRAGQLPAGRGDRGGGAKCSSGGVRLMGCLVCVSSGGVCGVSMRGGLIALR